MTGNFINAFLHNIGNNNMYRKGMLTSLMARVEGDPEYFFFQKQSLLYGPVLT